NRIPAARLRPSMASDGVGKAALPHHSPECHQYLKRSLPPPHRVSIAHRRAALSTSAHHCDGARTTSVTSVAAARRALHATRLPSASSNVWQHQLVRGFSNLATLRSLPITSAAIEQQRPNDCVD